MKEGWRKEDRCIRRIGGEIRTTWRFTYVQHYSYTVLMRLITVVSILLLCVYSDDDSRRSHRRQSTQNMMRWDVIDWLLERASDRNDVDIAAAIYTFRSEQFVFVPHVLPSLLSFRIISTTPMDIDRTAIININKAVFVIAYFFKWKPTLATTEEQL